MGCHLVTRELRGGATPSGFSPEARMRRPAGARGRLDCRGLSGKAAWLVCSGARFD